MSSRPRLIDRFMKLASPRVAADFAPPPQQLAPDLWALARELKMPGGPRLPSRSTIIRLEGGGLVVISPPPLGESSGIDALGTVEQVVLPNSLHHLFASEFMARHPGARLFAAPGLHERVPGLPPAEVLGAGTPGPWPGELEFAVLGPARGISEVVFFHVRSRTLILTDIAFNLRRIERPFERIFWRLFGGPDAFGPTRSARLVLLRDRAAVSRCLSQAARWPIQRIEVAHGDAVEENAKSEFLRAFSSYLPEPGTA